MGYCDICGYPAPCGRWHGEDQDGNDIKATHWVYDMGPGATLFTSAQADEITAWVCPHDKESLLLREAYEHINTVHGDCLMCSGERLLIAGILEWQERHPDFHRVS